MVQALHGMGGVGKTQLAVEYAHRFARHYDLAWWINSEQAKLIGDQVAALGLALGLRPGRDSHRGSTVGRCWPNCGDGAGWLLVFDNAEHPEDIVALAARRRRACADHLPRTGLGRSRRPRRSRRADPVQNRWRSCRQGSADSVRSMRTGSPTGSATCRWPSRRLRGSWPRPAWPPHRTWNCWAVRAGQLLGRGAPGTYPKSLAAATELIADRLASEDPAAAELASICAFLAPAPIPEELVTGAASELPRQLAARAADPLAWHQTLAHLARQSLARIDHRGLQMHKLTQAILRDRLTPAEAAATRARTEVILAANNPGEPTDPATWPRWARLMPHLLAADLAATDSPRSALPDLQRMLLPDITRRCTHLP